MLRLWLACFILVSCIFFSYSKSNKPNLVMGTTISAFSPNSDQCHEFVLDVFVDVDKRISEWKSSSPISKLNEFGYLEFKTKNEFLKDSLKASFEIAEMTDGAFDPTWAALWGLWDFESEKIPSDESLQSALDLIDWKHVELNNNHCKFLKPGMKIGLGAIGKGIALDKCKEVLHSNNIENYIIVAGGQVLVSGLNNGKKWRVGIRKPDGLRNELAYVLDLTNTCISTSGDYEKYFEKDGIRYHHIINPKTGMPARGTKSVTVITPNATLADALSTAFFVMGPAESIKFANRFPNLDVIIIDNDLKHHLSNGVEKNIFLKLED